MTACLFWVGHSKAAHTVLCAHLILSIFPHCSKKEHFIKYYYLLWLIILKCFACYPVWGDLLDRLERFGVHWLVSCRELYRIELRLQLPFGFAGSFFSNLPHMDAEGQNWPLKSTFTSLPKMWPKQRHRGEVHSVVLKAKLLLKLAHCRCCGGNRLQVSEWWYKCDQYSVCLFGFCWQPWTVCWKDSNATFLPANVYGSCWSIWNSEINAMVFPCYHKQLIQF